MTLWCATGAGLASATAAAGPASAPASANVMAARRPVRRMLTARIPFGERRGARQVGGAQVSHHKRTKGEESTTSAFVPLPPPHFPGLMGPDQLGLLDRKQL